MRSLEFEPIGTAEDFKMPEWIECVWRRAACGKESCKICGRILRDRQKHIEKGEDPDDLKSALEDVGDNFKEAMMMVKKDAERLGIDLENIDDIKEPPEPEKFPFYRKIQKWHKMVSQIGKDAEASGDLWLGTEAAADLFWYKNTLLAKVYRELCNIWHIEQKDGYGDFDYDYTSYVINECLKILKQSLSELSLLNSSQKPQLMIALSHLTLLEKQIFKVMPSNKNHFSAGRK